MLLSKVIIVSLIGAVLSGVSPDDACMSWANVKREILSLAAVQLQCDVLKVNGLCTGLNCTGKYMDYRGKVQATLRHCSEPVSLEVFLSIPQLGIQNWNHTFFHGERVPLPALKTVEHSGNGNGFLEMYLQRQDQATVMLGVSIVQLGGDLGGGGPVSVTLINNQTMRVLSCPGAHESAWPTVDKPMKKQMAYVDASSPTIKLGVRQDNEKRSCKLDSLEPCALGEMCSQSQGSEGVCICLPHHHIVDGVCQPDPTVPSTPSANSTSIPTAGSSDDSSKADSHLSVKIAVPVLMFVLLATLAGLAYKFRWVPKLRSRFRRSNIYEEMVIDGDDITTMQSPSSDNPIA